MAGCATGPLVERRVASAVVITPDLPPRSAAGPPDPDQLPVLARQLEAALASGQPAELVALLADDVVWGPCRGRADVAAFLEAVAAEGVTAASSRVDQLADRLVVTLELGGTQTVTFVLFAAGGRITEIVDAPEGPHAPLVRPIGDLGEAVGRRVAATAFAAILPVRDPVAASAHYRALGFAVEAFQGDAPYAFASWGPVDLHLAGSAGLDPATNSSMAYLYVDDADALYARWRAAGVAGRLVVPLDSDYGLREGVHVDPDGNLLRFGSPLAS